MFYTPLKSQNTATPQPGRAVLCDILGFLSGLNLFPLLDSMELTIYIFRYLHKTVQQISSMFLNADLFFGSMKYEKISMRDSTESLEEIDGILANLIAEADNKIHQFAGKYNYKKTIIT